MLSTKTVVDAVMEHRPDVRPPGPFGRWHLRTKYRVMELLFRRYVTPGARFVDMACGTGDGLLVATLCQPESEIWGIDIDRGSLDIARQRTPNATLLEGDMHNPQTLPKAYFDVVHEFGAAFLSGNWPSLAKAYFSLLCDGGLLLWELPHKWSTAHIAYLLSVAPKITKNDTQFRRILRSFLPSKYRFESDQAVLQALRATGCDYEIMERVPIWYFYWTGYLCRLLNWAWRFAGDGMFESINRITGRIWPRYSGYYLVIRKKASATRNDGIVEELEQ